PELRWREGDTVTLRVTNRLKHSTSIHWHGIILPNNMDGVPGLSYAGIAPGETFTYRFQVNQSGTYWYHSHSGFQEQTGHYGPLVIEPRTRDPFTYDRDYVVMLSDWTDASPEFVFSRLKKMDGYYNYVQPTVGDFMRDADKHGMGQAWDRRMMWDRMRMSPRDLAVISGAIYTYLMNGATPSGNWSGVFRRGEKVRLRFINGSAMSFFDVRIPGMKMTVVAADGVNVHPVPVDEFRIGVAETYDVIVEPSEERAYTIFAQSVDRSGYARGTLAPRQGMEGEVPPLDPVPTLNMADMGMMHDMEGMDMGGGDHAGHDMGGAPAAGAMPGMDHDGHDMGATSNAAPAPASMSGMDHSGHDMGAMNGTSSKSAMAGSSMNGSAMAAGNMSGAAQSGHDMGGMNMSGSGSMSSSGAGGGMMEVKHHPATEYGPGTAMHVSMVSTRLDDPGVGLRNNGRRVLTYADLKSLDGWLDPREPGRTIELHLTGNMERYMWSFDGVKFSDAEPIKLNYGERVRIVLVNDTMMDHPIHLHGLWSEIESPDGGFQARKHTVVVKPGHAVSYRVLADARGRWAYHCHLLYHMKAGMFREVHVV
ncbi:MAG TPA: copper resistance system multicopper oxidase, partial [Gammaproteobacteria bacterium]|nr:copper resistance system multicopper oxidase [Gammaproteobacteria bacterium]